MQRSVRRDRDHPAPLVLPLPYFYHFLKSDSRSSNLKSMSVSNVSRDCSAKKKTRQWDSNRRGGGWVDELRERETRMIPFTQMSQTWREVPFCLWKLFLEKTNSPYDCNVNGGVTLQRIGTKEQKNRERGYDRQLPVCSPS